MDPNLLHLAVAGVLTLVCVLITALIWKRAQVKTVFWWIGLTLVPMAVYLAGLGPAAAGAVSTLRQWWATLQFTPVVIVGLVLGGLAALLMLGSRLIPSESAKDRRAAKAGGAKKVAAGNPAPAAAVAPARPAPDTRKATGASPAAGAAQPAGGDAEFDEIAELLRKRGIN